MSEKKKTRLFDYSHEIAQIKEVEDSFLGLFDPRIRDWEQEVLKSGDDTEKKMVRRLTNTRFNLLDAINDLTKKIHSDLDYGGRRDES